MQIYQAFSSLFPLGANARSFMCAFLYLTYIIYTINCIF